MSLDLKREDVLRRNSRLKASIKPSIDAWIAANASKDGAFEENKLEDLVHFICQTFQTQIDEIRTMFLRRDIYPDIPAVKLYGCDGKKDDIPDIWLLGWRRGEKHPEGTSIHDHDDSKVFVEVIEGTITEYYYHIDARAWNGRAQELTILGTEKRILRKGETELIGAPYIHRMMDVHNGPLAVSVHAYYPPLDAQNSFVKVGNRLFWSSHWDEVSTGSCD